MLCNFVVGIPTYNRFMLTVYVNFNGKINRGYCTI